MDSKIVIPAAIFLLLCLIDTGYVSAEGSGNSDLVNWQNFDRGNSKNRVCYQCNSYEDPLCADPFYHNAEYEKPYPERTPKSENSFEKECDPDTAEKKHFCRKIVQTVRGDTRVIRSCGWVEDEKDRACYTTVLEEYNTEVCSCKEGDLCNGATGFSVSILATVSAVVLAYLIH